MIPECIEHLKQYPNDAIGALRKLPKRTVWLYVHAYQSFLWNRMASEYLKRQNHKTIRYPLGELVIPEGKVKSINIPLIGYETKIPDSISSIAKKMLDYEGIKKEDFRIPEMPEMVSQGADRELMMPLDDVEIGPLENDELNRSKKKCRVSFRLPKGSYATMAVKAMFE